MPSLFIIIAITLSLLPTFSLSDPRISEAGIICGPSRSTNSSTFVPNFVHDMESLSNLVASKTWGAYSSSSVYGLAQCHADLSLTDCLLCFAECRTRLPKCLPETSGLIFLDGCFLRYDSYNFFAESTDPTVDRTVCNTLQRAGGLDNSDHEYSIKVNDLMMNLTKRAVAKGGFGVGERTVKGGGVYGLVQCWNTLSREGCRECLEKAWRDVSKCLPWTEARGMNIGCYMRYSNQKFYTDLNGGNGEKNNKGNSRIGVIVGISSSLGIMALLLSVLGVCLGYERLKRKRQERKNLSRLSSAVSKSNLNFKYETLEKATDFFNSSRKLGQGAAGSVYKGILPDGRIIAVKRLFFNTRQWVDEFFNEVNLVSGVEHKNLVKLLGCSIEGPESLLVYEYVPNKSLDQYLFSKNNTQFLRWEQRFQIILGTAEGLAYLHGGTKTRIIHRDIKSSNILLDENMTAKIADFGLARCFSADKTHLSTGIAGTLGYMAPEYLVRGQLTEKADVYSFGVLVLEIVCGRKNSIYTQESSSVLQTVWKHFKSNTLPESVDQSLKGNFPAKEATDVLQVGLLCTQASVTLRPSMSEVIQMLADKECTIPLPMQPPFLNASVVDTDTSPRSSISNGTSTGPVTSVVDPDNPPKSSTSNATSIGLGSSLSETR